MHADHLHSVQFRKFSTWLSSIFLSNLRPVKLWPPGWRIGVLCSSFPSTLGELPPPALENTVSIVRMEGLNLKQSCLHELGLLLLKDFPSDIHIVCVKCWLCPFQHPVVRKSQFTATLWCILLKVWLFVLFYVAFSSLVFRSIYW